MQIGEFLPLLDGVKGSGNQYIAKCPAHDDRRQSLSISTGNDGRILVKCHAGCSIDAIAGAAGVATKDLFVDKQEPSKQNRKLVATYDYTDATGNLVHQKLRYDDKSFAQRRPDSKGGWVWSLKGVTPVLYNLPEVQTCSVVYVVEGEKDCETLRKYGKTATCGTHGAGPGKWLSHYNGCFTGKSVIIIQDNDTVGKAFAIETANSLHDVAGSLKLIDLTVKYPSLPEHGDISDVLALMGAKGMAEVEQLILDTPEYNPQELTETDPLTLICLDDVESQRAEWLWHPYIPLGKITLMQGDPGQGKTMLSLVIASIVSTGGAFYGDDELTERNAGIVIYQTAEDGIADTIKPRLMKMRPNFKNIFIVDESQEGLTLSDSRIESTLKKMRPKLMIIDPLQAYLGAGVDMHRANEIRPILSKLGRLAEQYRCAIILIMHMSKMSQSKALYRGLGSIDIPAAARSVLVIGSNPDNPDEKVMAHEKSSLARHGQSITFHIDFDNGGIVFDGYSELTADQITGAQKEGRNKPSMSMDEAVELLERLLGEKGYSKLEDIKAAAQDAGISKTTLYRAKDDLSIKNLSLGFSPKVTWWMLPNVDKTDIPNEQITFEGTWPPKIPAPV